MKKLIFVLFLLPLLAILSTQSVKAEGTFTCQFRPQFGCRVGINNCEDGHEPDFEHCSQISDRDACQNQVTIPCVSAEEEENGAVTQNEARPTCADGESINTAIGCIPFGSTQDFLAFFLGWAVGIGGGIAFLLIIYAGFQITTSSGNPERIQQGRELLTSAIAGLIMLIFSVFILRLIGFDILGLPGL